MLARIPSEVSHASLTTAVNTGGSSKPCLPRKHCIMSTCHVALLACNTSSHHGHYVQHIGHCARICNSERTTQASLMCRSRYMHGSHVRRCCTRAACCCCACGCQVAASCRPTWRCQALASLQPKKTTEDSCRNCQAADASPVTVSKHEPARQPNPRHRRWWMTGGGLRLPAPPRNAGLLLWLCCWRQ